MVKTRRGVKRLSPKSSKEEDPPDIENKKLKVESDKKSKYFSNPSSDLNKNIELDKRTNSSDSNDSLFRNKSKQSLKIQEESDSDGSSSDEFMKAPISLDDLGSFETLKKKNTRTCEEGESKPVLSSEVSRLSDDSDDGKETNVQELYDFSQIIKSQELIISTKKEQEEKCQLEKKILLSNKIKPKTTKSSKKVNKNKKPNLQSLGEELGISELLAIAEGPGVVTQDDHQDSESDDGNKEIKTEDSYSVPEEGVQVTIELPNLSQIRKKKGVDVEAALKRRMNLIRRENQIFMHKVHTLCWIAHGIYLNRSINNETLMGLTLSLIPSNHCYPKKHMDLRYLEKLVEWFVGKVTVDKALKLNLNSSNPSLVEILEPEINKKKVSSERDLVLIFVCMLRSLGISVRLVINLRPVPIRPPITDLCLLSSKPKEEISSNVNKSTSPSKLPRRQSDGPTNKTPLKKFKNEIKKDKALVTKESEIRSHYFSSSDDLPLAEVVRRKEPSSKLSSSPHHKKNNDKSISKIKSRKTISTNVNKTSKSAYFNNENPQKTPQKKQSLVRKSAPVSIQEFDSSSEDEVFQKQAGRGKKSNESRQTSNSSLGKGVGRRKSKIGTDDSEFSPQRPSTSKSKDRRVLSTDDEGDNLSKIGNDFWAEVFVEEEEKWISVDLQKGKVHCINQLSVSTVLSNN